MKGEWQHKESWEREGGGCGEPWSPLTLCPFFKSSLWHMGNGFLWRRMTYQNLPINSCFCIFFFFLVCQWRQEKERGAGESGWNEKKKKRNGNLEQKKQKNKKKSVTYRAKVQRDNDPPSKNNTSESRALSLNGKHCEMLEVKVYICTWWEKDVLVLNKTTGLEKTWALPELHQNTEMFKAKKREKGKVNKKNQICFWWIFHTQN